MKVLALVFMKPVPLFGTVWDSLSPPEFHINQEKDDWFVRRVSTGECALVPRDLCIASVDAPPSSDERAYTCPECHEDFKSLGARTTHKAAGQCRVRTTAKNKALAEARGLAEGNGQP
jgi:hypothetical protein